MIVEKSPKLKKNLLRSRIIERQVFKENIIYPARRYTHGFTANETYFFGFVDDKEIV